MERTAGSASADDVGSIEIPDAPRKVAISMPRKFNLLRCGLRKWPDAPSQDRVSALIADPAGRRVNEFRCEINEKEVAQRRR